MPKRPDKGPRLLVCVICQRPEDGPASLHTPRSGTRLLEQVRAAAAADPRLADLSIEPAPCLYNCQRDCSVHVRAPGKTHYMIEGLGTDVGSARLALDFAAAHMASPDGKIADADMPARPEIRVLVSDPLIRDVG